MALTAADGGELKSYTYEAMGVACPLGNNLLIRRRIY